MGVKGNWNVEIIDSIDVYQKQRHIQKYSTDISDVSDYRNGCGWIG